MNVQQAELYKRIQQFSLDSVDANLPFSQRLARDNGWTVDYAQRVIEEYKKFMVLAVSAGHPVTPSDQVDQVWHLHLLYTQSYWEEFCPQVLQTSLHHNPTKGGQQERGKFNDWYSSTLLSYETVFDQRPPADIWSSPQVRFGRDLQFRRVNTQQNWILPKPDLSSFSGYHLLSWVASFLIVSSVLWSLPGEAATVLPIDRIDFSLTAFLPVYVWTAGTSFLGVSAVGLLLHRFNRRFQLGAPLFSAILFGLFLVGSVRLIVGLTTLSGTEFLGFFVLSAIAGVLADFVLYRWKYTRSLALLNRMGKAYYSSAQTVQGSVERILAQFVLLCVVGLYLLGIARVGLGLYRHQPISYLVVLCLCIAFYLLWRLNRVSLNRPILKVVLLMSIVSLLLLLIISTQQFIWLVVVGWLLLCFLQPFRIQSSRSGTSRSWASRNESGTTCVNGDCRHSGDDGSGGSESGDGGCGGCGGGGGD